MKLLVDDSLSPTVLTISIPVILFAEKLSEAFAVQKRAFAVQKLLTFFWQKVTGFSHIMHLKI